MAIGSEGANFIVGTEPVRIGEKVVATIPSTLNNALAISFIVEGDAAASCALSVVGVVADGGDLVVQRANVVACFSWVSRAGTGEVATFLVSILPVVEVDAPGGGSRGQGESSGGDDGSELHGNGCSSSTVEKANSKHQHPIL